MATGSRQDHLIKTALDLFTENGFHATGIDLLMARAGMSKRTLYTYFKSKEELVIAALERQHRMLLDRLAAEEPLSEAVAQARLMGVFEQAGAWFSQPDFHGCVFVKAVSEHSAPTSPIRQLALDYKNLMRSHLLRLCKALNVRHPDALADEMALLVEGAVVSAQVSGSARSAETAARMAKALLDRAERRPARKSTQRNN